MRVLFRSRYRDYARDIHESGSHLLSIINDILDLSKVEAGRYDLHEGEVALGDVLSRCAALLRERAEQRQLTLTCRDSDIRLHADPRRSEEPTSELQPLMPISYAVLCQKKTPSTKYQLVSRILLNNKQHQMNSN